MKKAHTESDGGQRKTALRDSAEDLRGLVTDRKIEQDTRRRMQATVSGKEGAGEHNGINNMWENLDSGTIDGNDVWTEGMMSEIQPQMKDAGEKFTSERCDQFRATSLDRCGERESRWLRHRESVSRVICQA